jgi:hypothetical protein
LAFMNRVSVQIPVEFPRSADESTHMQAEKHHR